MVHGKGPTVSSESPPGAGGSLAGAFYDPHCGLTRGKRSRVEKPMPFDVHDMAIIASCGEAMLSSGWCADFGVKAVVSCALNADDCRFGSMIFIVAVLVSYAPGPRALPSLKRNLRRATCARLSRPPSRAAAARGGGGRRTGCQST